MAIHANSVFEVCMTYLVNGQTCRNFFHYRTGTEIPGFDGQDMQVAFSNKYLGNGAESLTDVFAAVLASNVSNIQGSVQQVWDERWRKTLNAYTAAGEQTEVCSAQNVQATLSKFGEMADRHNQGALHLGGLPSDAYIGGELTTAYKALLATFGGAVFSVKSPNIAGTDYVLVPGILKKVETVPPTDPPTYVIDGSTVMETYTIQPQVRTMRSRTIGKGE